MRSVSLPLLAFAATAFAATAAMAAPPPPTVPIETAKEVTRILSGDDFEGRAPATPAEDKTIAYIAARFARLGLTPGGEKGGWYQKVPLVELTTDPKVSLAIAGSRGGGSKGGGKGAGSKGGGGAPLRFAYRTDMVLATYQVRPRVELKDSEMVFVGYGINAPERGWNDYAGIDVKGKTVVILVNDPDWKTPTREGLFEGRAMTYYGRWTYKYEEAARQGAAAAIIIHETEPAAYPFDVVVSSWTGPQLEFDAPGDHMDQSKAIGWITNEAAHRLFAAAGKDYDMLIAAAGKTGFRAVPLGLTASATLENGIRRQSSNNVIGILPGSERPGDYLLYSAHWDHLGRCEPIKGDDICNGAIDNASGIGALVAMAETYKAAGAPKRSVMFVALTAKESGLLGSEYLAAHPVVPLRQIVGGLNMDAMNLNGATRDIVMIGGGKSELEPYAERAAKAQGRIVRPETTPERGSYFRSDHFSFAKLGVPMLNVESGEDLVNGGPARGRAMNQDYTDNRYHKPQDEYDPNWDWGGAAQDIALNYAIGRELADSDVWPNWYPTSEFKAIRDRSRAGK